MDKTGRRKRLKPEMLAECRCGHPFEEHDWGAYDNLKTKWAPACLVENCECGYFEPKPLGE